MEQLGLDPNLLIAQIVNFLLFFYLYRKFIAKPLLEAVDKERREEEKRQKFLERAEKEEEEIAKKRADAENQIKKEATDFLDKTRQEAELVRQEILTEARQEADEVKKKGRTLLVQEKEELYAQLKQKLITLSISIVERGLKAYLTEDARKKITRNILRSSPHLKVESKNEN